MARTTRTTALVAGAVISASLLLASDATAQPDPPRGRDDRHPHIAVVEAFVDSLVAAQMSEHHILGVVLVMVRDGEIVLSRGYGYTDPGLRQPVDPDHTLFPAGSLSKLVTVTAVMRLVEDGLLDLDADVNRYLRRFRIRESYSQPITLFSLLTHTSGLDIRYVGAAAPSVDRLRPLSEYLARELPPRVRPPGEMYVYTNHGIALAGHLIEAVTGERFERYMRRHVLEPLGMMHSSFDPLEYAGGPVARGYDFIWGRHQPAYESYVNVGPAGGLLTTGNDFGRFLLAHLDPFGLEQAGVLSTGGARLMHGVRFAPHPRLAGTGFGFYRQLYHGDEALHHSGWMPGTASSAYLLTRHGVGFFLAANSDQIEMLKRALMAKMREDWYPPRDTMPLAAPPADFASRAHRFTGHYRGIEYARRGLEHAGGYVLARQYTIVDDGDGMLSLWGPPTGPVRLVEVGPLLFQREDGYGFISFAADERDRVKHMFIDMDGFERISAWQTARVQRRVILSFLAVFASAIVLWPLAALVRRFRRLPLTSGADRWLLCGAFAVSSAYWVFLLGMAPAFTWPRTQVMAFGLPPDVIALLYLPMLAALAAVLLPLLRIWKRSGSRWSALTRAHWWLVVAAAIAFAPVLSNLQLLDLRPVKWREPTAAEEVTEVKRVGGESRFNPSAGR